MKIWRRELSPVEENEFRAWARSHYRIGDEINPLWHPVTKDECVRMNGGPSMYKYCICGHPELVHAVTDYCYLCTCDQVTTVVG
jgi:hypothetical protein